MNNIIEQSVVNATPLALSADQSPMALAVAALERNIDLDKLRQFMDLQQQWQKQEAEKAYNAAFAQFKASAVRIIRNKSVGDGPLKGKSYAELFAVVNAVTPELSSHGLSASWSVTRDEPDWLAVTCTLKHVGGHSESVTLGGPPDTGGAKNRIQARASTVTYLQRYTLKAILGLSEQDDDTDGNTEGAPAAAAAPAQPADPVHYPAADFKLYVDSWVTAIVAGKYTKARMLARVQTKGALTPEQLHEFERRLAAAKKPVGTAPLGPVPSCAELLAYIKAATNDDELGEAADLIGELADPEERKQLAAAFEAQQVHIHTKGE